MIRPTAAATLLALTCLAGPAPAQTDRASVDSASVQGNGSSGVEAVSGDGLRVAYSSLASNLVPGDTNGLSDVFVRDRATGQTRRVSVGPAGIQGNGACGILVAISADGRCVAFTSESSNLVASDTNGVADAFVHDRSTGLTSRASLSTSGVQASGRCEFVSISADGRFVAFDSYAANLVAGTTAVMNVFVRDRLLGTTRLGNASAGGTPGNGIAIEPSISGDGRYVAFHSMASNLVAGDTNVQWDVFVSDLQTGAVDRVSTSSQGGQSNLGSEGASISGDGRFVAFESDATNLVPGDTNGRCDVFVADRVSGAIERASLASGGAQANGDCVGVSISSDGRRVAWASPATNLVAGDQNGFLDVFVRDRATGTTSRASVGASGVEAAGYSTYAQIAPGGGSVAFVSSAANLVSGDTNALLDVFVRDLDPPAFAVECAPGTNGTIPCPCANPPAGAGRGCDNFGSHSGGAALTGSGAASLTGDTLVLSVAGANATALVAIWQGRDPLDPAGSVHGAGVRCVTSTLRRLYAGVASGGAFARPAAGDASVHLRSTAVGDPILPGEARHYFAIYRDPLAAGPCGASASTINASNAGRVVWAP